jgi:hypothetical protein
LAQLLKKHTIEKNLAMEAGKPIPASNVKHGRQPRR